MKLRKAELPEWYDWILVAFVAFHVGIHIILSVSPNHPHQPIKTNNILWTEATDRTDTDINY